MEGSTITTKILQDTPFKYPCNIYKENSIPILKDYNVADNCKEIGKHILNMTKNPLSQHVDVLIPNLDRNDYAKSQMEHFKSFFGSKYYAEQQQQQHQQQPNELMQETNHNTITYPNVFVSNSKASHAIKEFIDTEKKYVDSLENLVTNIMKPIRESIVDPNKTPILDQYSFNRIFINLDDILEVNKAFLDSLVLYKNGQTTETFGQILQRHFETFDCYKIYLLGKANAIACHTQNKKQNKLYNKCLVSCSLKNSLGISDVLISPIQRSARYDLMTKTIMGLTNTNDIDLIHLRKAASKVSSINDMRYGSDSSLLNLYHLIRDAPASLIQTRKLLAYYDASELSLLSGKTNRPVTILVFTDKIMIVKRKNNGLQSKEYLENIEEKVKVGSTNTLLQKAKEAYNGLPFEFKGWVDINHVELFNGLKERPDTFFLRTCLPELNPNATEKECENYFRRSDRLYSMIPSTARVGAYAEKKQEFLSLCQKQLALAKLEDTTELYHEDKFKLPAYSHIYNEDSYSRAEHKNNILIVYVEENYPIQNIDLNSLLTEQVWILILLTRNESGGYKPTIRARTSLIPIREISREIEYESIIETNAQKDGNAPLDFIDTLWNNLFFYERRLRATEAYSCINDDLLRDRARSRSRSKSLTRVASNMSIGKLFARSHSTSPSGHSSSNERTDDDDDQTTPVSCVPDPIFKVATINKHTEEEFRSPSLSHKNHFGPVDSNASTAAERGHKPSRINTQPHFKYNTRAPIPSEIFIRDDHTFIDSFNDPKQEDLFSCAHGSTNYQDNSHRRPSYPHRHGGSISSNNLDALLYQSSPELMSRPSSGGSNNSSASSETDRTMPRGLTVGDSASSNSSNVINSYFENNFFPHRVNSRHNTATGYDEKVMNTLDGSRRSLTGSTSSRRAPLNPNFYNNPQNHPPTLQHRSHTTPDMMSDHVHQFKNEVFGMFDNFVQAEQQLRPQREMDRYYNYAEGFKTDFASKIEKLIEDLSPGHQYQQR
ncbi:hypothetical protein MFLAVUS_000351 [Mucor flavus]|uniref:DH domain-containing protein n=1 Tax=Mucor flavus TaxID=439312 RepID=A0ABP9YJH0_9FUNG